MIKSFTLQLFAFPMNVDYIPQLGNVKVTGVQEMILIHNECNSRCTCVYQTV